MDQEKIGKFISVCRKNKKLTQQELAEKLSVSDRAVSKWERGLNLPDASLMLELSKILDITVTELLTGEVIEKKEIMEKSEEKIIELKSISDDYAKILLFTEYVIAIICVVAMLTLCFIAAYMDMSETLRVVLIVLGFIILIPGLIIGIKIEQIAGYYECSKCHHKYVPKYFDVFMAMHMGRTRFMKCPKCNKRSWQKKVINKE